MFESLSSARASVCLRLMQAVTRLLALASQTGARLAQKLSLRRRSPQARRHYRRGRGVGRCRYTRLPRLVKVKFCTEACVSGKGKLRHKSPHTRLIKQCKHEPCKAPSLLSPVVVSWDATHGAVARPEAHGPCRRPA